MAQSESAHISLSSALDKGGEIDAVKRLIDLGADVNEVFSDQRTPLHLACQSNFTDAVCLLLSQKADVHARDSKQQIPLHIAARAGSAAIVKELLNARSDIEARNSTGKTPFEVANGPDVKALVSISALYDACDAFNATDAPSLEQLHELLAYPATRDLRINYRDQQHEKTPLHNAAAKGFATAAKALLDAKADVDARKKYRQTPLHLAASSGFSETMKVLLDAGAQVDAKDHDGHTPLHRAAVKGHVDAVKLLLSVGSSIDEKSSKGETPVDLCSHSEIKYLLSTKALFDFFAVGNAPSLDGILQLLAFPSTCSARVAYVDEFRSTSLHLAAKQGFTYALQALLNARADIEAQTIDLLRPLHIACEMGHIDAIKLLLSSGATAIVMDIRDRNPLHIASAHGHTRAIPILIDSGVDLEAADIDGQTALHFASMHGHVDAVLALLDRGANAKAVSKSDVTPLHCAVSKGSVDIVQALLLKRANVDARDSKQRSSLHLASSGGHVDVIAELLNANADIEAVDERRQRCVHLAAENGRSDALLALLDAGATIEARDVDSRTCLHSASMKGHSKAVRLLIERGATIEAKDSFSATPLHLASARGHSSTVKKLIEAGADIHSKDADGRTPVQTAVSGAVSVFESYDPSDSVLKLRDLLNSRTITTDLSAMPSPSSIATAIQRLDADDFSRHQSLSIARSHLKSGGVSAISANLPRLSSLTSINMSDNPELGDSGVLCLLKSLPAHIVTINVGNTGLQDLSQQLLDCFAKFSSLINLDISDNSDLSNSDLKHLLQSVPYSLKSLSMCNLRLSCERIKSIETMLSRFKGLEVLNLSHNEDPSDGSFDPVVDLCSNCFPRLQVLDLSFVPALHNIPPSVSSLVDLRTLTVNCCENLASLPDELESMTKLTRIDLNGCKNLDFPPLLIASKGIQSIRDYLQKAKHSKPLKKCKIVFLGNGRSGKTSLLRTLAKLPLNPNEASTQGISASHEFTDKLQPNFQRRWGGAPELYFWDFAGQLEYSAAHEFFMSNRQAVYVVIFSTVDDREAQVHQVTYWLRTVLTRDLTYVRVVIVGTKIDLIEPARLTQELEDIERFMLRAFHSVVRKVAPFCRWTVSVKFVTSNRAHSDFKKRRRDLKNHIFDLSADIFHGRDRMLRFPREYSDMLSDVKNLREKLKSSHQAPVIKLSDQTIVTSKYKTLYGSHSNSIKLEALKILGDVGELIYYEVEGSPWICVEPQLIASAIALFADPSRRISVFSSRQIIFAQLENLQGIVHDESTHQKLFDFLLALKVVIRFSDDTSESYSGANSSPIRSSVDQQYLVPLAFKGRPLFWSEVVDVKNVRAIRGVRLTAQRMITVAVFVRAMSYMCSLPQHMWGCAFFFQFNENVSFFVRLAESRCVVDVVVMGPLTDLSSEEVSSRVKYISTQLGCGNCVPAYLCPQCCQSDSFLRTGNAHAFHFDSSSTSALPIRTLLSCSRYHAPSYDGVKFGVPVTMAGNAETILTDDILRSQLQWSEVVTGAGILLGSSLLPTQRKTSHGDVYLSFPSGPEFHAGRINADIETFGPNQPKEVSLSSEQRQPDVNRYDEGVETLRFRGTMLPNSFFVLTKQLCADDVLEDESLQRLLLVSSSGGSPEQTVPVRVIRNTGASFQLVQKLLKVVFSVGDRIVGDSNEIGHIREIEFILSLSQSSEICEANQVENKTLSVQTTLPHFVHSGCQAFLCFSANEGGGILCNVVDVISPFELKLVQAGNPDDTLPVCVGASMLPCQSSFGPNDHVLVVYKMMGKRATFDLFAGRSAGLELAQLTPADCSVNSAVSACWRDVENHWEVMLGTEFKNYEITTITMFRNQSREKLFFQELEKLKSSASSRPAENDFSVAADLTPAEKERRKQLQEQTLGHFNEFAEKFSLLPKSESKDVNLCVAWWGKLPSAYFSNAQHGFFNLPPHLKLDPGWFGEGFYLTQYPRYSDYYISGCSLSSRKMQEGHILLCYAALGRPYPVTQNPYEPGSSFVSPSSLCGKKCGPQCGGADSHDCHYATVKKDADSQSYYPCPWRQEPDFDEIVIFKSERILPTAFVSFQRRRKTLLWLDDRPDKIDNLSIRGKIPGNEWFDEIEGTEQMSVMLRPGNTDRSDGVASVRISGATGYYANAINGVYIPTSEVHCKRPVYKKQLPDDESDFMWIEYDELRQQWQLKDSVHRGNGGWALASISTVCKLEECSKLACWKVVTVPPEVSHISLKLNGAAIDPRITTSPLNREDQVDLHLFTSVPAIIAFLSDTKYSKFAKYPPSLFRILCNRRLFLGTVPVTCCSKTEFFCTGVSALLTPGSEITFEGERLFGGVEAGVTYYLASVRRSKNHEYFSVSKERGGDIFSLQPHGLQNPPMVLRASNHSLLHFFETSDIWRLAFPAVCIFHGSGGDDMRVLQSRRPNFMATRDEAQCDAFVAFEPMAALQELN